ncbi:MAG TPA: Hpt domain-containing protein [Rhizomicrobium sp.]|nr:Hpt domain-containing protein [Rhizomicrobium sp.]
MALPAAQQPVDLDHLARYTGGEAKLNAEVLGLFVRQCAESLTQLQALRNAPEPKIWRDTLHTLKGSALGIGAFALAKELAAAESIDPETAPAEAATALEILDRGRGLVNGFVAAYLAR